MKYYVDQSVLIAGDGSQARPFKSIQAAAERAKAGDIIKIAPGIYREYVNPKHGGTEDAPITYRGSVDETGKPQVIISGAEVIRAWEKEEKIWKV